MAASLHYELVYFSSFQIPHSISNGPTQSFLWLNLFDHSWKNSRLDLPNALYHKQTRIPRWTVIWFSFDNLFRHFNSQYRKYYLYLWPLPVKRTWKWLVQKGLSTELNEHESRMRLYPSECLCLLRKDDLGDIADPMNQIISAWVDVFFQLLSKLGEKECCAPFRAVLAHSQSRWKGSISEPVSQEPGIFLNTS